MATRDLATRRRPATAIERPQSVLPPPGVNIDDDARVEWLARARHDARLRPPPLRQGVVYRSGLVDRLLSSRDTRVVSIIAPAGCGKTTLMTLWLERENRPVAWLSVDRSDNDPATLLAHIVAALWCAGMTADASPPRLNLDSDSIISDGVRRVVNVLESQGATGVLMLDNVQSLHSRAAHDVIAELTARLPTSVQLVVAARAGVRLPVSVLRTQGALYELTAADLAMNPREVRTLLESMGIDMDHDIDELMSRTEGWPAGVYLAGLAVKAGSPHRRPLHVGGNDRFVADFLRSEVLDHLSEGRISFLTRTSVLEHFCGPLCDAVLGTTGSARILERLEQSNLLVVPLDQTRDWYRYHNLLREFLQAELQRREPDAVADLHKKAAEWFDANGMPEEAISHAQAAGDVDLAARIMGPALRVTYGQGRADTVFGWLSWFEHTERAGRYAEIAALGALVYALSGDQRSADRWASVFSAEDDADELPESAYILRAIRARGGTTHIRADAKAARRNVVNREWLAAALGLEGLAYLWDGDVEQAEALLARAVSAGERFLAMPAATNALAALAMIAIDRDDWALAGQLATRSLEICRENGLERYLTSGLTFAVAARCAVRRGEVKEARRLLAHGATIRPRLSIATPGISVQTLLELTRAHIEVSDIAGARLVMREASSILAKGYDLGNLASQYDEIKVRLRTQGTTMVGASALTTAELRLLPYLTTHLSFPEIGERLYVSRHTIKTQAMSIYRKLGASSRSEAVRRAMDTGLLTT